MNASVCASPLDWHTLLEYWLGELDRESEARIEEHYLGCAACTRRLEQLAALARGVRELTRQSGVNMVITERFSHRLSEDGLHVREYRVPLNGSVNCTVGPEDDIVVARLEAPLGGVKRIDMTCDLGVGETEQRQEDIPFIAESGGVVFAWRIDALRALPASTVRVRLLAVDEKGERPVGEYTFNHTPHMNG